MDVLAIANRWCRDDMPSLRVKMRQSGGSPTKIAYDRPRLMRGGEVSVGTAFLELIQTPQIIGYPKLIGSRYGCCNIPTLVTRRWRLRRLFCDVRELI